MSNRITFDFANMFTSRVGEHGLDQNAVTQAASRLESRIRKTRSSVMFTPMFFA